MVAVPQPSPTYLRNEPLYVGVDISKKTNVAALDSQFLRRKTERRLRPTFKFDNTPEGYDLLLSEMQKYAPLAQCHVIMEQTGHYHYTLLYHLRERGVTVYLMHVQEKPTKLKNDWRDAQTLVNMLYSQIALGTQVDDSTQEVHKVMDLSEIAVKLRSLILYRRELVKETTRRRNRLRIFIDVFFPEFTQAIVDPNCPSALNLRERFPTPELIAAADITQLRACCTGRNPGKAKLKKLQELAKNTIGVKGTTTEIMQLEQGTIIKDLRNLEASKADIEAKITELVERSREGKILMSIPMISPVRAAAIIAMMANINNFAKVGHFRAYCGWSPTQQQTGESYDFMSLGKGGNRTLKSELYLIALSLISQDTEWRELYRRLVPRLCQYDKRIKDYRGKNKAVGHVIGRLCALIYRLLKDDAAMLAKLKPGETIPPPKCYDRAIHQSHRAKRR